MLTLCDWRLALAAYSYEIGKPIMSDDTYDRLAKMAGERDTELPGFSDITGQWVNRMDKGQLDVILKTALSYNRGYSDLHHIAIADALKGLGVQFCCCRADIVCYD